MRSFGEYNPLAVFLCLICICIPAMFCANPLILLLALCGGCALLLALRGLCALRTIAIAPVAILVCAVANMLVAHNGVTVLLVINNNPITLESALYGASGGLLLSAVLLLMRCLSLVMTSEHMLYLFAKISPKLALTLSMVLRFIPLLAKKAKEIEQAQIALGIYKDDNIFDTLRGKTRILSILTTWALENAVTTADSMEARGYGSSRRTSFSIFTFDIRDGALILASLALCGVCICAQLSGTLEYSFYPAMQPLPCSGAAIAAYICFALLCMLPTIIEMEAKARWHSLRSKI